MQVWPLQKTQMKCYNSYKMYLYINMYLIAIIVTPVL